MLAIIHPSLLKGNILAPASKSSMQRACAAALLSNGVTTIRNPGASNDDLAALDVIQKLGAVIEKKSREEIIVRSSGVNPVSSSMHCGESGLGIRMFTPLAALSAQEITITGSGSLTKRPMHFFDEIFPKLGISISSQNGCLPLQIKGPLKPVDIEIDGSLSSQFLTGLLMAYAAAGADQVAITVNNLKSKPYIDLTLQVMKQFGVEVDNRNYRSFHFSAGGNSFTAGEYTVEGDWSGGSFLLVAGAVSGSALIRGLDLHSTQADKKIIEALKNAGAGLQMDKEGIRMSSGPLSAFEFDATDCPDLFPPLVALASYCNGATTIKGVSRLAHKESDRALTLQDEFGKMGVAVELNGDIMTVSGGKGVKEAIVHSRHDHRIAMACAVAALRASGPVQIEVAEAIDKSYPGFYDDLQSLGGSVSLKDKMIIQ